MATIGWTSKRVAGLSLPEVKSLRENALKLGQTAIIELCDAELAKRKLPKKAGVSAVRRNASDVVRGFHFVCPNEKGVTRNADGTAWTGTWVVNNAHADRAARIGAYVALHASKADESYLQGTVKDWRRSARAFEYADGRPARTPYGVDFLIQLSREPVKWQGDGAGEKGYFYGGLVDPS